MGLILLGSYYYGEFPPAPFDLVKSGYSLYIADAHQGFVILDIHDPTQIQEVGQCETPINPQDVAVSDSYAYIADGTDGLRIIDISDPTRPFEVNHYQPWNTGGGFAYDIELSESYLYLSSGEHGLSVIDISKPTEPQEIERYKPKKKKVYTAAISGTYTYMGTDKRLYVLDIRDPFQLQLVDSSDFKCGIGDITISGYYAYLAATKKGLYVVDISDPRNLQKIGSYKPQDFAEISANSVAVSNAYAYLTNWYGNVWMVDISVPSQPKGIGIYDICGWTTGQDVLVSDPYVYVACGRCGLRIYEIVTSSSGALPDSKGGVWETRYQVDVSESHFCALPATDGVTLHYVLPQNGPVTLKVFDIAGRLRHKVELTRESKGENKFSLSMRNFASAVYFLLLEQGRKYQKTRFVWIK